MPEKLSVSGVDKCNKCTTSDGGVQGPSPITHAEICCLYRLAHPGQSDAFHYEESQKRRCKDCPRLQLQNEQQQVAGPACDQQSATSSDPPQEGTHALATGSIPDPGGTGPSQQRKRKKIEARLRTGFKKLTLEIRPPKFKKKLWFGTFSEEEIERAKDAVNYFMGYNQPYILSDSPSIFDTKSLKGIEFEDLHPSCEDCLMVGNKQVLKYKYFARQVKEVILSVNGKLKQKSGQNKRSKRKKEPPQKPAIPDPTMPSGSTISSGTQDHHDHDPRPETPDSQLLPTHYPWSLPPQVSLAHDEEVLLSEILTSHGPEQTGYSLEEMFSHNTGVSPFGYTGVTEGIDDGFLTDLWTFPWSHIY